MNVRAHANEKAARWEGRKLDLATLEVIRNRLDVIAREMHATMIRSAYSILLKEGADCSTGLFQVDGQQIAQGCAIPAQLGMLIPATRSIIDAFPPERMREGDVYVMNDPYGGGTHSPDFTVVAPIIHDGRVIALSAGIAHMVEIGGKTPGSLPIDATDIYQEGLRFPPLPMIEQGVPNRTFYAFLEKNSRLHEVVVRDLDAMVASLRVGKVRLEAMCTEYGGDTLLTYIAEILDRSEVMTRRAISGIAPGSYEFTDYLDHDGVDLDRRIPIKVKVNVADSDIEVDFTGSSGSVRGPFNTVSTHTSVYYTVRAAADPDTHNNAGCYRPIRLIFPEDSVVSPSAPRPVNARTATLKRVSDALLGALAKAMPDRVAAAPGGNTLVCSFAGKDPLTGQNYVTHELCVGGMGARPGKDGIDAIETDVTNTQTIPAEAFETEFPLRVICDRLWTDSGGAGRYRGGLGREKILEVLRGDMIVSYRGERHYTCPWGLFGGRAAPSSSAKIVRRDGSVEEIDSKKVFSLSEGDRLHYFMTGGGGYGDPLERPAEAVVADVEDRKISPEVARDVYGVAFDSDTLAVDEDETRSRRARMAEARGPVTWTYDRGESLGRE